VIEIMSDGIRPTPHSSIDVVGKMFHRCPKVILSRGPLIEMTMDALEGISCGWQAPPGKDAL
jgi:hypothetical protein